MSALKTLKATEAIPQIRGYLNHSSPWLRKVARKTIERLGEVRAEKPLGERS